MLLGLSPTRDDELAPLERRKSRLFRRQEDGSDVIPELHREMQLGKKI